MNTVWAALLLLSLLTLLNSAAAVALIRQVGVLHLRLRPLPALQGAGGPSQGTRLQFETAPWELPHIGADVERVVLAFFSPTCRLCTPLMPALESLRQTSHAGVGYVLVTDADEFRAAEYLRSKRVQIPFVAGEDSFTANNIPAAPFVVVTDRAGAVLASGGVNTLEQIEWVIEAAALPPEDQTRFAREHDQLEETAPENELRQEVIGVVD